MPDQPLRTPSWRHRIRFSLRALMIAVLVLGVGLGWVVYRAQIQRNAVAAIERAGGSVLYDWHYKNGRPDSRGKSRWPKRLVDQLGPDYFGSVVFVFVPEKGSDVELAQVGRLNRLERLWVRSPAVTDAGLAQLQNLTRLQNLMFAGSAISDDGLSHLKDLTSLNKVSFSGTLVTDAGVQKLRRVLPTAQIARWP
jgi:hypothetical protein